MDYIDLEKSSMSMMIAGYYNSSGFILESNMYICNFLENMPGEKRGCILESNSYGNPSVT